MVRGRYNSTLVWLVGDREEHLGGKWEMEGAHSGGK